MPKETEYVKLAWKTACLLLQIHHKLSENYIPLCLQVHALLVPAHRRTPKKPINQLYTVYSLVF